MDFLKRNWLGVLGIIVGLMGIALSYFFYSLSQQHREPSIIETKNFPIFTSPEGLSSKGFAFVTKPGLREITRKVYVHELVIWNKGSLPIKRNDILRDIYLEYPDEVEVIDSFISSVTRPDIVNVKESHIPGGNEISISFDILENNDGFSLQIIYASDEQMAVKVNGVIEGVEGFLTEEDLTKENLYFGIGKAALVIFALLAVTFGVGFIFVGYEWILKRLNPDKSEQIKSILGKLFKYVYYVFIAGGIVFFIVALANGFAEKEGKSSIPAMEQVHNNKSQGDA